MLTLNPTVLNTLTSLTITGMDQVGAEQHIIGLVRQAGKKRLRSLTFPSQNDRQKWPGNRLTLQQFIDTVIRSSSPLSFEELELFIATDTDISSWLRAFNFGSTKSFKVKCGPVHTSKLNLFWAELQQRGVSFKHLTVTCAGEALAHFLESTSELETLIFNRQYWNLTDISCISGHFHCLRSLLLPRVGYTARYITIRDIRTIVMSCPKLEEFGLAPNHEYLVHILSVIPASSILLTLDNNSRPYVSNNIFHLQ